MARPVKTHTFFGKKFGVEFGGMDGLTVRPDHDYSKPDNDERWIWIREGLSQSAELETVIHESLHACNPDATEEWVTQAGHDIARLLWRLGWRKEKG